MRYFWKFGLFLITGLALSVSCKKDKYSQPPIHNDNDEGVIIDGVRWATRNVDNPGTFASNPEDAGMFYQWNRNIGWSNANPLVNSDGGTYWNNDGAIGDTWEQENDPCPCGWRVPTIAELQSLVNSSSSWGTLRGVNGFFSGNGKQRIFLPAVGYRLGNTGTINNADSLNNTYPSGGCWSSNPNDTIAYYLSFSSTQVMSSNIHKAFGFSVRCVSTQADTVTFIVSDATDISLDGATFDVSVASNIFVTDKGICYSSENIAPTTTDPKNSEGSGVGNFSTILADLIENTNYHVRPYAIAHGKTYYGETKTFRTLQSTVTFIISDAINISPSGATFDVSVASNTSVTDKGICYSLQNATPTTDDSKISKGSGIGDFSATLTDLIDDSNYYVCPYAIANGKTFYGEVKTFKTLQGEVTFNISSATNISSSGATFDVSVASNISVIDKGVCYSSQNATPTTENFVISAGSGAGNFNATLTDLTENTYYYVRPYAITSGKIYYGEVKTFTTLQGVTFTISDATDIFLNGATFDVSIAANILVTDKGICYSSQNVTPTMADHTISKGSGNDNFSVTLTGLVENTKYYVRPYAIANGKTFYGEVKTFRTLFKESVLINGILWATHNLDIDGIFVKYPEDYGALFQWGRLADGHESRTSKITTILSTNDVPGHANFILAPNSPYDWRTPQNDALWGVPKTVNDPCPPGWRLPTKAEFESLIATGSVLTTQNGVVGRLFGNGNNTLFLPFSGDRSKSDGSLTNVGSNGYYWSSTTNGVSAYCLNFYYGTSYVSGTSRANGYCIRCVVGE